MTEELKRVNLTYSTTKLARSKCVTVKVALKLRSGSYREMEEEGTSSCNLFSWSLSRMYLNHSLEEEEELEQWTKRVAGYVAYFAGDDILYQDVRHT